MDDKIAQQLQFLYGEEHAALIYPRLLQIINAFQGSSDTAASQNRSALSEQDTVLITYGDMLTSPAERPLHTLYQFLARTIAGSINTVHLLPFFPYSSDDGFSIIDYRQVDPPLGDWPDIWQFKNTFRLMFDAVVNHVSVKSDWFQQFSRGVSPYNEYFIEMPGDTDLSRVFRPRALPLLSEVQTVDGTKLVWTTFSADQIDLNFANPEVLLAIIDTLLFYVEQGADLIRLDAIAFIWKEVETSCVHLPQTHTIIQLMRSVLDIAAPHVLLITETNVPHEDNIAYFGDGFNEAQMVYNFSLPPLVLHAFHTGSAKVLSEWAAALILPSTRTTFFNFLASHDGIGLTPARGLLDDSEISKIAERTTALGGHVSYRSNPDGSKSPYELNISYIDALGTPGVQEGAEHIAKRFLAAQAIMLSLRGVPGIYFHSLFGSQSWPEGVEISGHKRRINRQKLDRQALETALGDRNSLRAQVFFPFKRMIRARAAESAFHPGGRQKVLQVHPALFALWRQSPDGNRHVLCLHNVSDKLINDVIKITEDEHPTTCFVDILSGQRVQAVDGRLSLNIPAYGVWWLQPGGHESL